MKGVVNSVTTTYIGNYFEWTGSTATMKSYYYAGSVRVAMRTGTTLNWLLGDHLGSTSITTDGSGVRTADLRYKPWGEVRYTYGTTPTTYRFTSQRQEIALGGGEGLYYYGARWMDPNLGRFASPDSIIPDQNNPQSWDRYSYVNNSPVNYTDPTGHRSVTDGDQGPCKKVNCGYTPSVASTDDKGKDQTKTQASLASAVDKGKDHNNDQAVSALNTLANVSQDAATFIDFTYSLGEGLILTIGLLSGGPETVPVVVGGMDIIYNGTGGNLAEMSLSALSLVFTGIADFIDDGKFGENTATSLSTAAAGTAMPDPIGDLIIDGYASGYNHGLFNGFNTIMNGGSLINKK